MMEVCVNNNTNNNNNGFQWSEHTKSEQTVRPKRDFRFQVIEVCQGPKWFIWPSRNRSSTETIDENHNKDVGSQYEMSVSYNIANQYSSKASNNGYGAMRRSVLRSSKRLSDDISRTSSEPVSSRRVSLKKEKAVTEPINGISNTFKILSIAKKWESFDATDDEESNPVPHTRCECQSYSADC
ncbi:unnamed protein product [Auanema sp. JU1783]|nr:unnamed protein product [Auanema sp. JU1783]